MDAKQIAGYVGGLISIGLGVALVWFPPSGIGGQAGTFLTAGALWTGGLGAFGLTIAIPALREGARREVRAVRRSSPRSAAPPPPAQ